MYFRTKLKKKSIYEVDTNVKKFGQSDLKLSVSLDSFPPLSHHAPLVSLIPLLLLPPLHSPAPAPSPPLHLIFTATFTVTAITARPSSLPSHLHHLGLQHRPRQNPSLNRPRRRHPSLSLPILRIRQVRLHQTRPNWFPLRLRLRFRPP